MAAVNVPVKGLTGLIEIVTLDDADNLDDVLVAAVTAEGLDATYYGSLSLVRNTGINTDVDGTVTLSSINFVGATGTDPNIPGTIVSQGFDNTTQQPIPATDIFIIKPDQAFVGPNQTTLEDNQVERLDIAQLKRRGGPTSDTTIPAYRVRNTYDINTLPAKYVGNVSTPNTHPSGLLLGRPWTAISANPNPTGIDDAVSSETLQKLEGQFDASATTTIVPGTSEGQNITQWTDQSDFSHNLNSTGSQKAQYRTIPATINGYGFIYFNGTSSCMTVNPISNLESQNKVTYFLAARVLDDNGTVVGSEPSTNPELSLITSGGDYQLNFGTATTTTGITRDSSWHVFTVIYDGTQATNATKYRLRIDSADIPLTFTGTVPTTTASNNNTITMGCEFGGTNFCEMEVGAFFLFLGDDLNAIEVQNVENLLTNEWVV
jgi:hypothetical protein